MGVRTESHASHGVHRDGFCAAHQTVFETIYQPTVKLETEFLEESKYFIKHRRFEFHIEPVFEKYLYTPVVTVSLAVAARFRIIQTGSLHVYLAYTFVTLVVLLIVMDFKILSARSS